MSNPEHLKLLEKGVKTWNKWREDNPDIQPDLSGAKLEGYNLYQANLTGSDLIRADLNEANLREADLRRANLSGALLIRTNFNRANLLGAKLNHANLVSADLSKAILNQAKLNHADLSRSKLNHADLSKAHFNEAFLRGTDLSEAYLSGANLSQANLSGANFIGANLSQAKLIQAKLSHTNLSSTIFSSTNLEKAQLGWTVFANVNLSETSGLETAHHTGPSSIGIDTLYMSNGNIPDTFLKGCGVTDTFIEYARSLAGNAIDYYSCFISYSNIDEEFARRIHSDLQSAGVRCWFAPHEIKSGKKVHHQIEDAIRIYDKLLLILSENSMNSSWVKREIIKAKKKEDIQGKQMLFPISVVPFEKIRDWELFHSDSGRDLAEEIREYHIPFFSKWKSNYETYKKSFDRLLSDLKTE